MQKLWLLPLRKSFWLIYLTADLRNRSGRSTAVHIKKSNKKNNKTVREIVIKLTLL